MPAYQLHIYEQQEERDALFAKAYMSQMVRAGKSWGKK